jgi:phospholipase C
MRVVLIAALTLTGCSTYSSSASGSLRPPSYVQGFSSSSGYIQHVIVVIQENRSFDNFFSTFPGADGTSGGCMKSPSRLRAASHVLPSRRAPCPSGDEYVPLAKAALVEPCDYSHHYHTFLGDYDGGSMDGFGLENGNKVTCPGEAGTAVYQYVDPSQIAPYWTIAQQYVLGDRMFQTQGSGSFTAHQDLVAASTILDQAKTKSLVDFPDRGPWGCDAPAGTKTDQLFFNGSKLQEQYHKGPFPCLTYETLRDLLDAKSVSWRYYSPPIFNKRTGAHAAGSLWNAFDAIAAVRKGPEWKSNIAAPKSFFGDVKQGRLAAVSWIVPDETNSDHPANDSDTGPSWVASIVNAIGESSYWDSSAIVVVWDDWGGFYDHEPPPFFDDWGGLGFRVPMLVVSAYAREAYPGTPGYVSHTQYEFGSILRFIEDTWGLGTLGTTDQRATSIVDCLDFTQPPRTFVPIQSKYSQSYFERQPPSYQPVDTQ